MASIDLVRKKIAQVFTDHGISVDLVGAINVVRNSLGEIIGADEKLTPQTVVLKRLKLELEPELAGDLPEGTIDLVVPPNSLIKEASLIRVDGQMFQVKELIPYRAFGEIICFVGNGERADGLGP